MLKDSIVPPYINTRLRVFGGERAHGFVWLRFVLAGLLYLHTPRPSLAGCCDISTTSYTWIMTTDRNSARGVLGAWEMSILGLGIVRGALV